MKASAFVFGVLGATSDKVVLGSVYFGTTKRVIDHKHEQH